MKTTKKELQILVNEIGEISCISLISIILGITTIIYNWKEINEIINFIR